MLASPSIIKFKSALPISPLTPPPPLPLTILFSRNSLHTPLPLHPHPFHGTSPPFLIPTCSMFSSLPPLSSPAPLLLLVSLPHPPSSPPFSLRHSLEGAHDSPSAQRVRRWTNHLHVDACYVNKASHMHMSFLRYLIRYFNGNTGPWWLDHRELFLRLPCSAAQWVIPCTAFRRSRCISWRCLQTDRPHTSPPIHQFQLSGASSAPCHGSHLTLLTQRMSQSILKKKLMRAQF